MHATGVIKESGKKFWSTKDAGQRPFTYQAGVGNVSETPPLPSIPPPFLRLR